jgi:hypothetical protein
VGLYLYCVTAPDHPPPDSVRGLDGAPVRRVAGEPFGAWVSDLDEPRPASLEAARIHNAVIEEANRSITPLPLRFGQWFESEEALLTGLEAQRDRLLAHLRKVGGRVEFGVRVIDPAAAPAVPPPDRSSGRAYLEDLARRSRETDRGRRRGEAIAAELADWVGDLVRDQRVRPGGADALVAIAHLVARHDTGTYLRRIHEFPATYPTLRFSVTGPWPPYGFVE